MDTYSVYINPESHENTSDKVKEVTISSCFLIQPMQILSATDAFIKM